MKISLSTEGWITDKEKLQEILSDLHHLEDFSNSEFISSVISFIKEKKCCSLKQYNYIEEMKEDRAFRSKHLGEEPWYGNFSGDLPF